MDKEVFRSFNYLITQDYVFNSNLVVIAKHFLKDYFEIDDVFRKTFQEILHEFNKINAVNPIKSNTENEFFSEICEYYLGIERDPGVIITK